MADRLQPKQGLDARHDGCRCRHSDACCATGGCCCGQVKPPRSLPAAAKLCYVNGAWAFFTTREPFTDQWGDDWNDAPYEHNTEDPYEWRDYMAERGIAPYKVVRVAWRCDRLDTPDCLDPPNSRYSVEQINAREVPWLHDPKYGERPRVREAVVWAGATLQEFIEIIEGRGGTVYLPRGFDAWR